MDMIRWPYRSRIKPWRDRPETVGIRWYRAEEGAPVYPGVHNFASLIWEPRDRINEGVGEQTSSIADTRGIPFGNPPAIFDPYRGENIHGVRPSKGCGAAEAFRAGGRDGLDPPLELDADGIPLCCKRADQAQGGVALGGAWIKEGGATVGGGAIFYDAKTGARMALHAANDAAVGSVDWDSIVNPNWASNDPNVTLASGGEISHYLRLSQLNNPLPEGSIPRGFWVRIRVAQETINLNLTDYEVKLFGPNGPIGNNRANGGPVPFTFSHISYGGFTDDWGADLTLDLVNDPDFGVGFSYVNNDGFASTVTIDNAQMAMGWWEPD
jgi:hypothetical protein